MLSIITKKYEIEEEISLADENDNKIYSFMMQLSADDLKKLKESLLNKNTLKLATKIKSLEDMKLSEEESDNVLEMADKMNQASYDLIGELCFKEHKDEFIEKGGEAKYSEMVEMISDFLLMHFMSKQTERANTMNTNLAKITKK